MGVVFKAEDTRLRRDVAIKFLPRHGSADRAVQQRFETEARAAASLNHPNITHVHAIEELDGESFIVMEYVAGRELGALVESRELTFDKSIAIALRIASGLKAAHDRGVVHRDIKSANIMVTSDGHVKIMDFGLAKTAGGTRITQSGMVVGTVDYMSPEQILGEEVDPRTDIWSFGVVLYEMLTGVRPYRGEYAQAMMYSIANSDAPPPSTLAPGLPDEVVVLVKKMLSRNRDNRPANIAEVINALESMTKGTSRTPDSDAGRKAPAKAALPGVAVLPFASIRPDPESDFLGFALADQIIGALAYIDSVAVRPSSAVRKYQGQSVDVPTAGRDLHADFVLTGHYLRDANTLRLNVELVATPSNDLVWRDSVEVKYDSIFKLQDMVAKKVLRGLRVQFPKSAKSVIAADTPGDPLAYEYYLRAVSYPSGLANDRLAIEMLDRAIKLDPDFAPAHAELGFRWAQEANYGAAKSAGYKKAESEFRRALSLNENQLSALSNLILIYIEFGRHEDALDLMARLFRLTPNSPDAHFVMSYLCRYTGMTERSLIEGERAVELDPKNPRFRSAGFAHIYAGHYERAAELFSMYTTTVPPIAWQGWALMLMGNHERAIACFDHAIALEPGGFVALRFGCMRAYLKRDVEDGMQRILAMDEELSQRSGNDTETEYMLAACCALFDDRERCVRWLRSAVRGGFFNYPALVKDPFLDSMREDAEFQQVLALARQKHEEFKAIFSARMP